MEAYRSFAEVYDLFMDNVPYDLWRDHLVRLLRESGVTDGLVAELGCGTGKMTRRLAAAGYDMIGIDSSCDMLNIAMEGREKHATESGQENATGSRDESKPEKQILYLCQDMREFELYGTVAAVVSVCDSMNYILTREDLIQVFSLVNNYLDPGGVFIFDMNTRYKYEQLLGDGVFAENRPQGSFIWENYFDEDSGVNQYDLTLYIRREDGCYERYEETHLQRCYETEQIRSALEAAGMEFVDVLDADTLEAPQESTQRIYVIARERGKEHPAGEAGQKSQTGETDRRDREGRQQKRAGEENKNDGK